MNEYKKHVFTIGLPLASADGSPETMGFKAYNLARMARLGLPVPPAFVLSTALCRMHGEHPRRTGEAMRPLLESGINALEGACGTQFGSPRKPLLVSVRSGAAVSMPGMMDTLLDIGLTETTLRGLLRTTGNPRLVWDSYRRLVQQFAEVVHRANAAPFHAALEIAMDRARVTRPQDLDFRSLAALARGSLEIYEELVGTPFPQDPYAQLEAAVTAVFDSWKSPRATEYRRLNALSDDMGTAVTVQRMVFGNAGGTSGAGVGFTRDPATGENQLYLDFRFNSQGEDVVSGRHSANDAARLATVLPGILAQLQALGGLLEREFRDAQEFEFTVQDGVLWMLQTRSGKRTPWAALRIAVEQVEAGLLQPREGLERLEGLDLAHIEQRHVVVDAQTAILAEAIPASIGVSSGVVALDTETVKGQVAAGRQAILVREDTSTADIAGIAAAHGTLTARGGRTAHAAVVARHLGKACLVGCASMRIDLHARKVAFGTQVLNEGEVITLDCENGRVLRGEAQVVVERPTQWIAKADAWRK